MQGLPTPIDSSWSAGRASRLVSEVLPVAPVRAAVKGGEEAGRNTSNVHRPVDQAQRERLMAHHRGDAAIDGLAGRDRRRRAVARYDAVAGLEQRQQLEEILRFSAWA